MFACPAYFHVIESKLDPKIKKAIFLGFSFDTKAYKLSFSESKKVVLSRDVTFDKSRILYMKNSKKENMSLTSAQRWSL